jgi:hypothetical protein
MPTHVIQASSAAHAMQMQARRDREVRQAIRDAHLDAANATLRLVLLDTDAAGLVDMGSYKAGWQVRELADETRLENNAPHAGVIEGGARPFTPPLQPLIDWVERKAGDLGIASKPFGGRASLSDAQRAEAKRIAYAIQQKFKREGIKPRYVMRGRLDDAQRAVERAFREYLEHLARPSPKDGKGGPGAA